MKGISRKLAGAALGAMLLASSVPAFAGGENAGGEKTLEQRLTAVEDYIAIEQLLMKYAAALNTDDADTYVSLFTEDASFELKRDVDQAPFFGPFVGHDALRKQWFPDVPADNDVRKFGPMRHVTTNYEIDLHGDKATIRAFFIEVISNGLNSPSGSKPPTIYQMGRYEDEAVKQNGKWLFSKRAVITDMNTAFVPDSSPLVSTQQTGD
jgi:hypothetical protein